MVTYWLKIAYFCYIFATPLSFSHPANLYASLIGFYPRRLKASTGDELPRNGPRSMRNLLLLLLLLSFGALAPYVALGISR